MRPGREALAYTQAAFCGCSRCPSRASRPCSESPILEPSLLAHCWLTASVDVAHGALFSSGRFCDQALPSQPLALQVPVVQRITVVDLGWEITLQDTKWAGFPQSCCSIHGTAVHRVSLHIPISSTPDDRLSELQARSAQPGPSQYRHSLPCCYKTFFQLASQHLDQAADACPANHGNQNLGMPNIPVFEQQFPSVLPLGSERVGYFQEYLPILRARGQA